MLLTVIFSDNDIYEISLPFTQNVNDTLQEIIRQQNVIMYEMMSKLYECLIKTKSIFFKNKMVKYTILAIKIF